MKTTINRILQTFEDYVANHDYLDRPILTAYVDVDTSKPENQRSQPAWEIELKNAGKALAEQLEPSQQKRRLDLQRWAHTEAMLKAELVDRKLEGRSVVFFSDLEDSISVDLPVPMPTRLYYGIPQVKHMLFALDQYKKYLVILLSGAEVRVAEVFLTRNTGEVRVETDHDRMHQVGIKAKTLAKDRREAAYERRFVSEVANDINAYFTGDPEFDRIIFGGNAKQAHAVVNALHPAVQEMVVAIAPVDFKAPEQDVAALTADAAEGFEAERDLSVVEQLVSVFNRGGPAVIERQGVETALAEGRVRTLVLPYPIDKDEFDSLILQATAGGADIEFVTGAAAERLAEFGGIGARLYWS